MRDIIFFQYGDMIFKHISIFRYTLPVLLFVGLTSLNKHEHCTFQKSKRDAGDLYECISEGNRLSLE